MITSKKGIELIKMFEGLHDGNLKIIGLQPKLCPAGIWTEGYGRAMRDENGNFLKIGYDINKVYQRITIKTEQDAEKALKEDLQIFERIVLSKILVELNQNQFDALVSYTYNTGGSSTLYRLINAKASDYEIRNWMENHYIKGDGKVLSGLVKRRKEEAELYFE